MPRRLFLFLFRPFTLAALVAGLSPVPPTRAQAPAWQLAVGPGASTGSSTVQDIASDANGNVYLVGLFNGTMTLGSTTLASAGATDVFVAKWSPANNAFSWAQRAGGTGEDYGYAVAVNGASVYIAGSFNSPAAGFGTTTLAAVSRDAFVAKITDGGSTAAFTWATRAGGSQGEWFFALAVNGPSVYLAGNFDSPTLVFGSTTLTNANPSSGRDVFIAKVVDAGATATAQWAQRAGGTGFDDALGIAVAGTSVYVTGTFQGPAAVFGGTTLSSAGNDDAFVAKLEDAGPSSRFVWAHRAGGPGDDQPRRVAVSGANVFVAGSFAGACGFGTAVLASAGNADGFVAKLVDAGPTASFAWAQGFGGANDDRASGLAVQGAHVYVAGGFRSATAGFGTAALLTNAAANGSPDVFLAKLVDAGGSSAVAWAHRAGGGDWDFGGAVAWTGTRVYVAGEVTPPASFGSQALANPSTVPVAFLASLTDPTLSATASAPEAQGLVLYPNPAHTAVALTLAALPGAAAVTLTLLDALGREVRQQTVRLPAASRSQTISVAGLPPGLYTLRVQAGATSVARPLLVE